MTLTLDAATEKRIQREIDLGHYANPAEVVAHALDLLAEQAQGHEPASSDPAESPIDEVFGLWADRHINGLVYQEKIQAKW